MSTHLIHRSLPLDLEQLQQEEAWLLVMNRLIHDLEEATDCPQQIGPYWCSASPQLPDPQCSLGIRVRSRRPLPGIHCDNWEATVCLDGDRDRNWTDAFVFPFLEGARVTSLGRHADPDTEPRDFPWYTYTETGWQFNRWEPDWYGEWASLREPGDLYFPGLDCQPVRDRYRCGEPLLVRVTDEFRRRDRSLIREPARFSLIHANRNRENTNSAPWGAHPPRRSSPHVRTLTWQNREPDGALLLDLSRLSIRHGWKPGKYHLALRVQRQNTGWDWDSSISLPFHLVIEP